MIQVQPVARVGATRARPLRVLDEAVRRVYFFLSDTQLTIYCKTSDMDSIAFPGASATPFIASDVSGGINDVARTKQSVDASAGMVASASAGYWHGTIEVP